MERTDYSIVGKRFGKLVVVKCDRVDASHQSYWLCECDCGNKTVVRLSNLKTGNTSSCGCGRHKHRFEDLTGKRYGRLIVTGLDYLEDRHTTWWKCECDCGNTVVVRRSSLISGNTSSCGCLCSELSRSRAKTHGLSKTPLYKTWIGMQQRCENPDVDSYERYGKRGISVCDEWECFENFRDWSFTHGYKPGLSIDRIDNDGDYSPDNCRWADSITQANNRSNNRYVTFGDSTHTIAEWARILNVNYYTLWDRIARKDMTDFEKHFGI